MASSRLISICHASRSFCLTLGSGNRDRRVQFTSAWSVWYRLVTPNPVCLGTSCILGQAVQSIHRQVRDYLSKTTLAELARDPGFAAAISGQEAAT